MLCFHGWGSPAEVFSPFSCVDRGYFGHKGVVRPSKKVVTHSFGLHWADLSECEELVILSGFLRLGVGFLEEMKMKLIRKYLQEDPVDLLGDFYSESGYTGPAPWLEGTIDVELLLADLDRMQKGLDGKSLLKIPKVTLWQAKKDKIVLKDRGAELQALLPHAEVVWVDGGHMATLEKWKEKQQLQMLSEKPEEPTV